MPQRTIERVASDGGVGESEEDAGRSMPTILAQQR